MGVGTIVKRAIMAGGALALLAACEQQAPPPKNDVAPIAIVTPEPVAAPELPANGTAPAGDLAQFLVGAWSFESDCATDFSVHYYPDGRVENSGNNGRWKLEGDTVTETITERFEMGGEPETVNPPEVLRYTVTRVDEKHAVLTLNGRKVPIQRC